MPMLAHINQSFSYDIALALHFVIHDSVYMLNLTRLRA